MIKKVLQEKYGAGFGNYPLDKTKPPIIFVHGAGGSYLMWIPQVEYFKKDFNPVAVDLPGHALSPPPACEEISGYADFVLKLADALELEKFFLVGLSMGGAISQEVALKSPEQLLGLVLMSTGARLRVLPELFKIIRENWEGYLKLFPQWAFSPNAPAQVVEQSVKELATRSPEVVEADFRACDSFDRTEQIKNIHLPTLIISADQDRLTPPKYSDYLHQQISGSELVRIEGAGHVVNLEKPEEVNQALEQFFQKILSAG